MKVIVELDAELYERVERGEVTRLYGAIGQVEVRQRDGLLSQTFRCRYADPLGSQVAANQGLPDGKPAIAIWLAPEQEDAPCLRLARQTPARQ